MTQTGRMWGWVGGGPKGGDGLPRWLRGERLLLPMQEIGDLGSIPGSERFPEEGNGNLPVFMPGKSHGHRSLVGYSP